MGDRLEWGSSFNRIASVAGSGLFRAWPFPYLLLLSGAVALQAVFIDRLSLWNDELFSIFFAGQDIGDLLGEGWQLEESPPLYYLALKGWTALFGTSETAVRLLSLLASVLTLPVIAALARTWRLGSARQLAVLVFATAALPFGLAAMARPYALWVLFLSVALLGQARLMTAAASSSGCSVSRCLATGILFLVGTTAALYTHTTTLVFVAAANLFFMSTWLAQRPRRPQPLVAWLLLQCALLVVSVPQLAVTLGQFDSSGLTWMPEATPRYTAGVLFTLFAGHFRPIQPLQFALVAANLTLLGTMLPRLVRREPAIGGLLLLTVSGFAVLWAVSLVRPILLPRTAVWLLVPISLMTAAALSRLEPPRLRRFAVSGFLALSAVNIAAGLFAAHQMEPWREYLAALAAEFRPSDRLVLMNGAPALAVRYYLPAEIGNRAYRWDATEAMGPGTSERWLDDRVMPLTNVAVADIEAMLGDNRAVWLVGRRVGFESQNGVREAFTERVAAVATETLPLEAGNLLITRLGPR